MSSHGATLQNFNAELVRSLEGLKERRDNIIIDIQKEEEKKNEIEEMVEKIKVQLYELNETLIKKQEVRDEFDKVIGNTEGAYLKLLEGTQTLLTILKRDEANLMKKIQMDK